MTTTKDLNIFKYTDYGNPVIYQKSDYRTSQSRAHHFTLSAGRKFVPAKVHVLCDDLKNSWNDYRPKSETFKEFSWKINGKRNHREDLAPPLTSVRYNRNFTDRVKIKAAVIPLNYYRSSFTDVPPFTSLPREPETAGYFPYADCLLSTTQLDFYPHPNYGTARTNLIVRKELPFNSDVASFIPNSKLINKNPLRNEYSNLITRDVSHLIPPAYDRIVPNRSKFVKNFGLTSEMSSNY
jgi:hypothetical protein